MTAVGDRAGVDGSVDRVGRLRRPLRRLSMGHVAVALAAVLAFVANVAFLRANDPAVAVVAVTRDLPAGHVVTADDFTTVDVRADASVLSALLTTADGLEGRVVRTHLAEGSLVGTGDLIGEVAPDGRRAMSVPVTAAHAAGGTIRVGDRVDVVDVTDGVATYVLRDVAVLARSEASGGALNVAAGDHVVLAVEEGDVLALAEAIADGDVDVVVTTGSRDG